jgi:hypothetical protein
VDHFAVMTIEYYLRDLVSGLSDIERQFFGVDELSDQGEVAELTMPRVIVTTPMQGTPIGFPRGPALDMPFVDTTEVAVYVETPLVVGNPGGSPDEVFGYSAVHIPTCTAIRSFLRDERAGLVVPDEIINEGCEHSVFGLWQPNPPETTVVRRREYYRHVFHAILQTMEVT